MADRNSKQIYHLIVHKNERSHSFIRKQIQTRQADLINEHNEEEIKEQWYKLLPDIAITYNNTTFQDMCHFSPYELMFNRKPKNTALSELNIFPLLSIYNTILEEFTPDIKQAFATLDQFWSKKIEERNKKARFNYNVFRTDLAFIPGDHILYIRKNDTSKSVQRLQGTIKKQLSNNRYTVNFDHNPSVDYILPGSMLRKFHTTIAFNDAQTSEILSGVPIPNNSMKKHLNNTIIHSSPDDSEEPFRIIHPQPDQIILQLSNSTLFP